jgi:hypothetical protein
MSLRKDIIVIQRFPIGRILAKIERNARFYKINRSKIWTPPFKFYAIFHERDLICNICGKRATHFGLVDDEGRKLLLMGENDLLFTLDHIIPKAHTLNPKEFMGIRIRHIYENYRILCTVCNMQRGSCMEVNIRDILARNVFEVRKRSFDYMLYTVMVDLSKANTQKSRLDILKRAKRFREYITSLIIKKDIYVASQKGE